MEQNGYVKGSLFWKIVSAGCAILILLSGYVIANDRMRAEGDEKLAESFGCKLDIIGRDITDIKVSVARIAK